MLKGVALLLEEEIGDFTLFFEGDIFVQEDGFVPEGVARGGWKPGK